MTNNDTHDHENCAAAGPHDSARRLWRRTRRRRRVGHDDGGDRRGRRPLGPDRGGRLQHGRPLHDRGCGAVPGRAARGRGDGRCLGHRRRLRTLLPRRDRPLERLAPDQGRRGGPALQGRRRRVRRVSGRKRRSHGRCQQGQRLGNLSDHRAAGEDLGTRLEGEELERDRPVLPGRGTVAFRARHRLGHVRLLHRRDQRRGGCEPLGLQRQRERQRHRHRRRRRERRPRLLRLLLLRGEPGHAEGDRDRRRRRLRRAERRDTRRTAPTSRSHARCSSTRRRRRSRDPRSRRS